MRRKRRRGRASKARAEIVHMLLAVAGGGVGDGIG